MRLFIVFSIFVSLVLSSSSPATHVLQQEYDPAVTFDSTISKLSQLILELFEQSDVASFGYHLNMFRIYPSTMKKLIEYKFEVEKSHLSLIDLFKSEGHLFLLLAKHQKSFPLLKEIVNKIGSKVRRSSSPKKIAFYELILRFPRIYSNLPLSISKIEANKTFDLLVDYAFGNEVHLDRLNIVRGLSVPFFKSLLDFQSIPFNFNRINSYLKLLAYSKREIICCLRTLSENPSLNFAEATFQAEQLVNPVHPIGENESSLAFLSQNPEFSFQRMANLIIFYYSELMSPKSFLAFKRVRKLKFSAYYAFLITIPDQASQVLLKYYSCEAREVNSTDIQAIIDLTADQRSILKIWQTEALGYHDSLSNPEEFDRTILFEDLLKLGVEPDNNNMYLLAKTIVPYIIDPVLDFSLFKGEMKSGELADLQSEMFADHGFPFRSLHEFGKFVGNASTTHDIIANGSFFFGYYDQLFKYFFGRFLGFHLSLERDLDPLLWGRSWNSSSSKKFFNGLYNALMGLPYDLDSIIEKLNFLDQNFLKLQSPSLNYEIWANRLIECIERNGNVLTSS